MKIFGKDKQGNLKATVIFDKPIPKKPNNLSEYVEIIVTQKDIDIANESKPDNPPSQCSPIARQLHKLGMGNLTLGGDWGFQEKEITEYLQKWDRDEQVEPTSFLIKTTDGKPLHVAILNPTHESN